MTTAEIGRVAEAPFIIAKCDEGFRVCSPLTPAQQFVVSGLPDNPQCTCPQFTAQVGDPEFACEHILAVLKEANGTSQAKANGATTAPAGNGGHEPPARTERKSSSGKPAGGSVMVLKRSVSPDGRIDSLSVEFSCPLDKATTEDIKQRADRVLVLQAEIAAGFLKLNGKGAHDGNGKPANNGNGTVANAVVGQMLAVASMNGKWGRRLFINVLVNGQVLKLFGSDTQLAEAVRTAGFPQVAGHLADGLALNLPCQVVTKPSPDGKYTNIERVLPASAQARA